VGRARSATTSGLTEALRERFGFAAFRPGQEEIVRHVLDGDDVLAVMPTGSGKSLCFQLPAALRPGCVVVVAPLISLMKDQVDGLAAKANVPADYLASARSFSTRSQVYRQLVRGDLRLLYVSPERLRSSLLVQAARRAGAWLVVVDEAHCISEWGHDFRPDYRHIRAAAAGMGVERLLAVTATATPETAADIVTSLGLRAPHRVMLPFDRPELYFQVQRVDRLEQKLDRLQAWLAAAPGPTIIYCASRSQTEQAADFVQAYGGVRAATYHGGLEADERQEAQEEFLGGRAPVLCGTCAFGLGIDKPDVRLVVHLSHPGSLEAYYQESGRAGRDGQPARCVLLFSPKDRAIHDHFISRSFPSAEELQRVLGVLSLPQAREAGTVDLGAVQDRARVHRVALRVGLEELVGMGALAITECDGRRLEYTVQIAELPSAVLAAYEARVERWRDVKRRKLAEVIAYATGRRCRREMILSYFGDACPRHARCCDVCNPAVAGQGAAAGGERFSDLERAILGAVAATPGITRAQLVRLLAGVPAAGASAPGRRNPWFGSGRLEGRAAMQAAVDDLVQRGLLVPAVAAHGPLQLGEEASKLEALWTGEPRGQGAGARFLAEQYPRRLEAGGFAGWALAYYRLPDGTDELTRAGGLFRDFKYRQDHEAGEEVAEAAVALVREHEELGAAELLVPMPPSDQHRPFDPVSELARLIEAAGGPPHSRLLSKRRSTKLQKDLATWSERLENVAECFEVSGHAQLVGRRVLLLDDLFDSGATMVGAARALVRAGARSVTLLAVVRTARDWER